MKFSRNQKNDEICITVTGLTGFDGMIGCSVSMWCVGVCTEISAFKLLRGESNYAMAA